MNWQNLKNNLCPKCGYELNKNEDEQMRFCQNNNCDFAITFRRYRELTENIDRGERRSQMQGYGFE